MYKIRSHKKKISNNELNNTTKKEQKKKQYTCLPSQKKIRLQKRVKYWKV